MRWSNSVRKISGFFYKLAEIPSELVGWGLSIHRLVRSDDSVNKANEEYRQLSRRSRS